MVKKWNWWWTRGDWLNVTHKTPHSMPQEQHQHEKRLLVAVGKFAGICPWKGGSAVLHAQLRPRAISHFSAAPQSPARLSGPHRQLSQASITSLEYKLLWFQFITCCNGLTVMWIKARLALNNEAPNLLQAKLKLNSTYRRRFFRSSIRRPRAR